MRRPRAAPSIPARQIVPVGDRPAAALAWHALLATVEHLGAGAGAHPLGRLPFITATLLGVLCDEATSALTSRATGPEQWAAPAGPALARLAVSRQLRTAVSQSVGFAVTPTYNAVYLADPPGSLVRPHIDKRGYDLTVHVVLTHDLPPGSTGTRLLIHRAGAAQPEPLRLHPGEAVVVRARATVHGWTRLAAGERRTMVGIGFVAATTEQAQPGGPASPP